MRGTLRGLARWPVKSLGGESLQAARADRRGLAGDRRHALVEVDGGRAGKPLTARQSHRLLAWRASYPDHPDELLDPDAVPQATVAAPDGRRWRWDGEGLDAALADDLGHRVLLHRSDVRSQQDLPDTVLVTTAATLAAVGDALGEPIHLRRFRSNLHVELDAPAFAEEAWEGGTMTVGGVRLELLHPCPRCVIPTLHQDGGERWPALLRWLVEHRSGLFGINARVETPGVLRVGDRVSM